MNKVCIAIFFLSVLGFSTAFAGGEIHGTLRLGLTNGSESKWMGNLKSIKQKDQKGQGTYKLQDPIIGKGNITLRIADLTDSEGYIMEITPENIPDHTSLSWAFGGCEGISAPFAINNVIKPIDCKDVVYSVEGNAFTAYYGTSLHLKVVMGVMPQGSEVRLSNGEAQQTPLSLFNSGKKTFAPVLSAMRELHNGEKLYICMYVQNAKADYNYYLLPELFAKTFKP